jgi:hypothetical protein
MTALHRIVVLAALAMSCSDRPLELPACKGPSDCGSESCCYGYVVNLHEEWVSCSPACPKVGVDTGSLRVCVSDDDCGPTGTPFAHCCPMETVSLGTLRICLEQCV